MYVYTGCMYVYTGWWATKVWSLCTWFSRFGTKLITPWLILNNVPWHLCAHYGNIFIAFIVNASQQHFEFECFNFYGLLCIYIYYKCKNDFFSFLCCKHFPRYKLPPPGYAASLFPDVSLFPIPVISPPTKKFEVI